MQAASRSILVGLITAWLLGGCDRGSGEAPVYELTGAAMGTTWSVKVANLPETLDRLALRDDIEALILASERSLSTYLPGSDLSRFNASRSTDWVTVSAELCAVVDISLGLAGMTDGAFDITIGPLVNLWGFGPGDSVTEPPTEKDITAAIAMTGHEKLHSDCDQPALRKDRADLYVDLSAFAKGYTVDKLAHTLDTHGVADYLVEIGGELMARGHNARGEAWAIAIEEPRLSGRAVQTIVGLSDSGMATSGDYRNFFRYADTLYSHSIDPRSGRPIDHSGASVTVVAKSTGFADAMATALLVMGPDAGIAFADRHEIAAFFMQRTDEGIEGRRSAAFANEVALK